MRFGLAAVRGLAVCGLAVTLSAVAAGPKSLSVAIKDKNGSTIGTATFKQKPGGVEMKIDLRGIAPGPHGVHIHEHAVCDAPDFKGAGGHFNPDGKKHGYLNEAGHHNGDFSAGVDVGDDHTGTATVLNPDISLDPTAPNSLFLNGGTSIVVHEKADDDMTDPSGNSGARIGCGVIKQ